MTRFLSFLAIILMTFSMPVVAQEDADDVLAEQVEESSSVAAPEAVAEGEKNVDVDLPADGDYEERLKLSKKMHEIWPVRPKIESALEQITQQIPQQERLKFKAGMRKAIQFDALEAASVDAMADIFTAKELMAMIDFYGSKEGRSVSHKTSDYERALHPVMIKMIDKALADNKLGSQ